MNGLHPEELAWNRERRRQRREAEETVATIAPDPNAARMCAQAAAMLRAGPDVVQHLVTATTPAATDCLIRPPQVAMSFGERAAYQMGQASVVGWLIEHGTVEVPDGGDPGVR